MAMIQICDECGDQYYIEGLTREEYNRWRTFEQSTPIQEKFPNLSSGHHDLLIEGICQSCSDERWKDH